MRGLGRGLLGLVDAREPAWLQALLRLAFGALLLFCLFDMVRRDVVEALWVPPSYGGMAAPDQLWVSRWPSGLSPRAVWSLVGATSVTGGLVFVGLGGRWVVLGAAVLYNSVRALHPAISGGYDTLLINGLLLLSLGSPTATWSLDARVRSGRWCRPEVLIASWPRYLLAFQLVIVYTATGLKKGSVLWTPFDGYSALYYILMDTTWRRLEPDFLTWALPFARVGTAVTWHWEQSAPLLLLAGYFRYTEGQGPIRRFFARFDFRLPWLAVGLLLHIGILAFLMVGPFTWMTLAFYPSLFGPGELERGWAWARRRGLLGRGGRSSSA